MEDKEYSFKMQQIAQVVALQTKGVVLQADRFKFDDHITRAGQHLIRLVLNIATQEEDLCRYPADWWQALKERWSPEWLKRKTPVKWTEVIAMHKYPELSVPDSVLGREFVNLKIVEAEELVKKDE